MKVIFLDIDGVLNSARSALAFGRYPMRPDGVDLALFDEVAVAMLRRIAVLANAQIVLSSSWRENFDYADIGTALNLPITGQTPSLRGCRRGQEIQHWLDDHPQVTHWAILDDMDHMLPVQRTHLIQTSSQDGLRHADALHLCELLDVKL